MTGYELHHATVIDPAARSISTTTLSITNGTFGRGSGMDVMRTADLSNLYVLPGLIDMHMHLVPSLVGGRELTAGVLGACQRALRRALDGGVTTIRDLGGPLAELLTLRQLAGEAPRLFIAGPVLTAPGGHGMHSGHGLAVSSASEARESVTALAQAGVDHIKIVTSGASGNVQLTSEAFAGAVEAAKAAGLPVAVHAHFQPEWLDRAADACVTSIEHGFMLHAQASTLERMARNEVALCPTLRVIESIREAPDWRGQVLIPGAWDDAQKTVHRAHLLGIQLIAGTDYGVFGVREADVWREISLVSRAAGSRWAGLQAATCRAARVLGRPDLGTLAEGACADYVVLRRNPVQDEVDQADVVAVAVAGNVLAGALTFTEAGHDQR